MKLILLPKLPVFAAVFCILALAFVSLGPAKTQTDLPSQTNKPAMVAKAKQGVVKRVATIPKLANVTTLSLPDIDTFANYYDENTGDTFTGTGFVGMYGSSWAHLLGAERNQGSESLTDRSQFQLGSRP